MRFNMKKKAKKKAVAPKLKPGYFRIADARAITIREDNKLFYVELEYENKPWMVACYHEIERAIKYAAEVAKTYQLNIEFSKGIKLNLELQKLLPFRVDRPYKVTKLPDPAGLVCDDQGVNLAQASFVAKQGYWEELYPRGWNPDTDY